MDDSGDESLGASKDGEEDNTIAGVMVREVQQNHHQGSFQF